MDHSRPRRRRVRRRTRTPRRGAHTDRISTDRIRTGRTPPGWISRERTDAPAEPSRTAPPRVRPRRTGTSLATSALLAFAVAAPAASSGVVPHPVPVRPPTVGSAGPGDHPSCTPAPRRGVAMSEGIPTGPGYSRSTGTVHALTLVIDFPDAPGEGTARQRFAEFFPQTSRWFARASYGRLDYRPAMPIHRWVRMPHSFHSYGVTRGSGFEPGYRRLVNDIVATVDRRIDFRRYDFVNVLVTPNAGPPAAQTVLSVSFAGNDTAPSADGVPLGNVSFIYSRQDDGTGSYRHTGFRVLPHENGHVFGLPDLYTRAGGDRAGHWDVMSEDWGVGNDLLAWHKWKLGWLTERQVECAAGPGTWATTLSPLGRPGGTKLTFVPVSPTAGYTVEARTNEGNDDGMCKPGVLVSWVDTRIGSGGGPITVVDSTPGSAGCTEEPNVHPALSDAALAPEESYEDDTNGIHITVTGREPDGDYRVRITRRASAGAPG